MSETASEAKSTAQTKAQTEYVILRQELNDVETGLPLVEPVWVHIATAKASSAHAAIRGHTEEGVFVAVPARSWRPMTATPKVTTTLELKPA